MDLTTLASGQVDLKNLYVDLNRRYCVNVQSDGPTTVVLTGGSFSGHTVAGAPARVTPTAVTLSVPAGTSSVVVAPRGVQPAPGRGCP